MLKNLDIIAQRLGGIIRNSGDENVVRCPFCERRHGSADTKGHLYINERTLWFFCHRCEAKGKIGWLAKVLNLGLEGEESSPVLDNKELYDRLYAKDAPSTVVSDTQSVVEIELPDNVRYVWDMPNVMDYAMKRGLSLFDCEYYNIYGYIDSHDNERLLFCDYLDNKLVFWQGRAIDNKVTPKYQTAQGVKKSHCVWNLGRVSSNRIIYIAEGILSARACGHNAVAIYGKHLSTEQKQMIISHAGENGVCVVLDGSALDSACRIATSFIRSGVVTRVVRLPGKLDPDDLRRENPTLLEGLLLSVMPVDELGILKIRAEAA